MNREAMDLQTQVEILNRAVSRIVVLMMENRSIDHLLGWLPPARGGLTGAEFSPVLRRERREEGRAPREDDEDGGLRAFAASLLRRD